MNKLSGKMLQAVLFILFVALASVDGWAMCNTYKVGSYAIGFSDGSSSDNNCQDATGQNGCSATVYSSCEEAYGPTPSVQGYFAGYTEEQICGYNTSCHIDYGCKWGIACYVKSANCYANVCGTQCEADSLGCLRNGGAWTNTGASTCGGKSCKVNHCKAADSTWLSTSIAACTGSNNYAIVNTDSTCEHVGTCCPNDSIPSGNTCKWRCDSVLTTCEGRVGTLFGAVLPDTSVSGQDTTFSYQCFYNCAHAPNTDSTVYLVEGNIVLSGPSDSIPDGIKSETFNSVRTTTGGVYVYDYLSPAASEYIDSIAAMKCVEHLWRCVINSKYVYWYDNQEVPAGCTNIVRVK